jgi:predicted nucleic-acid-binding Zn-ribbon protein
MTDRPARRLDEPPAPNGCPKCGGRVKWAKVRAIARLGMQAIPIELESVEKSGWGGPPRARVRAKVCVSCGFTEFYTQEPEVL